VRLQPCGCFAEVAAAAVVYAQTPSSGFV